MKRSQVFRKFKNKLFSGFAWLAIVIALFIFINVLWKLLAKGLPAFNWDLFTEITPPPGSTGGLLNAIVGSILMTGIAVIISAPMGILVATYITEYGKSAKLARAVRFINDVLLSAPSIIIGLFIYGLVVRTTGQFSAIAGALALAMIALPIITRVTEDALGMVSDQLREAAIALGSPQWKTIIKISYRAALRGILTGILLSIARIAGETAPLLFTSLSNQFWNLNLTKPMASLPVVIYQYAMSPYPTWQTLAWGGALLITLLVLVSNITGLLIGNKRSQ